MLASRYLSWRLEIGIEIEINDTFMERHGVCAVLWLWVFFVRAVVVVVVVRRCIMSACLLVSHDYTVLCLMYHVSPKRKQAHMWSCPFAIRASGYYSPVLSLFRIPNEALAFTHVNVHTHTHTLATEN